MSESTSGDTESKYADVEGIYVDDDGNPHPELAELSKSGGAVEGDE